MSNKKYSKEFKLKLIKEHEDNGVSFYAIGLILLIGACGSGGAFFYLNPWSSSTKRIWFRNTILNIGLKKPPSRSFRATLSEK